MFTYNSGTGQYEYYQYDRPAQVPYEPHPGDIVIEPSAATPIVNLSPDVIKSLREFNASHPAVDLNPIINQRIRDLLDECYEAEGS